MTEDPPTRPRTAAVSTPPRGAERMRTDAHGGSVQENSMRVIGLGATHGLNGLFPFFCRKKGDGWSSGGLSPPLQPPSAEYHRKKYPPNSVHFVRLPRNRCRARASGERIPRRLRAFPNGLRAVPGTPPMRCPRPPLECAPRGPTRLARDEIGPAPFRPQWARPAGASRMRSRGRSLIQPFMSL